MTHTSNLWQDFKIKVPKSSPSNLTYLEIFYKTNWQKFLACRYEKMVETYQQAAAVFASKSVSTSPENSFFFSQFHNYALLCVS